MLKKIETPHSLISIFRQSMSNGILDCNVILCKNLQSSQSHTGYQSNHLDISTDVGKSSVDIEKHFPDANKDLNPDESNDIHSRTLPDGEDDEDGSEEEEEMIDGQV